MFINQFLNSQWKHPQLPGWHLYRGTVKTISSNINKMTTNVARSDLKASLEADAQEKASTAAEELLEAGLHSLRPTQRFVEYDSDLNSQPLL